MVFIKMMQQQIWTHGDRQAWIHRAINCPYGNGMQNGYKYVSFPLEMDGVFEDEKRAFATSCLADVVLNNNPTFKKLSLAFYPALIQKVFENSFLKMNYINRNFVILVKGSNGYKFLMRGLPEISGIEHSDMDISILINPFLHPDLFSKIKESMVICVSQVMSRYKKDLDNTLCANTYNGGGLLSVEEVKAFKDAYAEALCDKEIEGGVLVSPFADDMTRNECSRKSFIICNSVAEKNQVVRVEVPHLNRCERIPLKKSPFVVSHNNTITFKRDKKGQFHGEFDLIRLRLNNMFMACNGVQSGDVESPTQGSPNGQVRQKVVPADFIDVSIPSQHDSQLVDFWMHGGIYRCMNVVEPATGITVVVPNIDECIRDLHDMLYVYDNNQIKVEKRKERLDMFVKIRERLMKPVQQ
jgi:hypothetical protein